MHRISNFICIGLIKCLSNFFFKKSFIVFMIIKFIIKLLLKFSYKYEIHSSHNFYLNDLLKKKILIILIFFNEKIILRSFIQDTITIFIWLKSTIEHKHNDN